MISISFYRHNSWMRTVMNVKIGVKIYISTRNKILTTKMWNLKQGDLCFRISYLEKIDWIIKVSWYFWNVTEESSVFGQVGLVSSENEKNFLNSYSYVYVPLIGLIKIWPTRAGLGSSNQNISVSLVPRLTATSPLCNRMPASDEGLSPVNATTLQSGENPYLCTIYCEILPIFVFEGTGGPNLEARPGAHA